MTSVYVSNADSGDITVLHMAADGALQLQSRVALGGRLMPMAIAPDQRHLYVARRSEPMALLSLAIAPGSGDLQPWGQAPLPASMAYISTALSGRFLLAASYQGHQLSVSPIAPDGAVGAVQQVLATGPNAHAIGPSPCQRYVLATSLGAGQLMVFGLNPETGQLAPVSVWAARVGAGPRHFRFDAQGRFVYLLNELDGTIDVLRWQADGGQLSHLQTVSLLPPGWLGQPWAADLHLTPDGLHLYASERTASVLAHFAVDPVSGLLRATGHTEVESQPRGFAIDPSGQHLLVVGELSHHLSRYAIDADTGGLTWQQRVAVGQGPNWVEVLP